jgi:glutamate 5-kinase
MRLVIKTGSAILSKQSGGLDSAALHRIASQIHTLFSQGHEIVLVSSGAIAAGVSKLAWTERPTDLRLKQAAAAVGQLALMKAYEEAFSKYEMTPAQILLTRDDLDDR